MHKNLGPMVAAALCLGLTLNSASRAHAVPVVFGGSAYEYVPVEGRSWSEARAAAEASVFGGVNGHLVTIFSSAENDSVLGLLTGVSASVWIGATDEVVEGAWRWVTGEQFWSGLAGGTTGPDVLYANWALGQPDNYNGSQDHATMFGPGVPVMAGRWDDGGAGGGAPGDIYFREGYVVEYDLAPVPEPSTLMLLGSGVALPLIRKRRRAGRR